MISSDSDSIAIKKVQDWRDKYNLDCKCNKANFRGNILNLADQNDFEGFIKKVIRFYKLDINFIDPANDKTVWDFTKEQLDWMTGKAPDNEGTKRLEKIFKILKSNGALYAHELKQ